MTKLLLTLICALVLASAASASPAPHLANQNATGKALVVKFFTLLKNNDAAGLQKFLAPSFQVQRADGSADGKVSYMNKLPKIFSFRISRVISSYANGALVVRYLAKATGLIDGKKYTPGWAPRLSVFSWNGARWQLSAHSNFNPLTG